MSSQTPRPAAAPVDGIEAPLLTQFDSAFRSCLTDVLRSGRRVEAGSSESVGSGLATRELLNYSFTLDSMLDRWSVTRPLSIIGGVGRFAWMMSGSDRLRDIAFYEPKVGGFTDDGRTVPGSSYGARILNPRPGLNQLAGAEELLRTEPGTRRAAVAVFQPEDAIRRSRDIPCTFGILWHIRDGSLHATSIMRSNNAWLLLPYNVFEFTLLAEVLAAKLGVTPGSYHHLAVSMHIYETDADRVTAALDQPPSGAPIHLPRVPQDLVDARLDAFLEYDSDVRELAAGFELASVEAFADRARQSGPFWSELSFVLLAGGIRRVGDPRLVGPLLDVTPEWLAQHLRRDFASVRPDSGDFGVESRAQRARFYADRAREQLRKGRQPG